MNIAKGYFINRFIRLMCIFTVSSKIVLSKKMLDFKPESLMCSLRKKYDIGGQLCGGLAVRES